MLCRHLRRLLRKAGGFGDEPEYLEHQLVSVEVIVGGGEQLLPGEDGVGASQEAQGLLGHGEAHTARGEPHHRLWHHDARRGDHPDHLPDFNRLK